MRSFFIRYKILFGALVCMSAVVVMLGVRHARGVPVDVVPVQAQPLVQTVIATGRVMSPARVDIGSVITGRVAPAIPGRVRIGGKATERKGRAAPRAEERTHFREWKTRTRMESDLRHRSGATGRRVKVQTGERLGTTAEENYE